MRIGILTQPLHNNYGGLLQNYALQQVLLRAGHEVETIDQDKPRNPSWKEWGYKRKMELLHILTPTRYAKPRYNLTPEEKAVISKNTGHFINTYIHRTPPARSTEEFAKIAAKQGYDAFVVGSDQCWRPIYNPFLEDMFLGLAERRNDIRRIAYAASFGTDEWEMTDEQTMVCSRLAQRFDLVTVREKSGVDLCREYLGVQATHVLDPTMLLDKEEYVSIVLQEHEPQSQGSLFHYILDPNPEKLALVEKLAAQTDLRPFTVMPKYQAENRTEHDVKHHIDDCVFPSVTSWLRGFIDAEMVVVDSFHGAVFSIIFNKPFWVIGNVERGMSRFTSLLHLFNLERRLISLCDFTRIEVNQLIDWKSVNDKLSELRSFSTDLLLQALK